MKQSHPQSGRHPPTNLIELPQSSRMLKVVRMFESESECDDGDDDGSVLVVGGGVGRNSEVVIGNLQTWPSLLHGTDLASHKIFSV